MKDKTTNNRLRMLRLCAWIAGLALLIWCGVRFAGTVRICRTLDKNPQGFFASMVYMTLKGKDILIAGVWTTVRIALLGTGIAFILAILLVFLRIQEPNKRDKDFVKALKWLASHFARLYVFVIRGTPMMVQALIFYYFGFNLFKRTGMTVTEINHVWSFFISGLCTVALNSTAYLTEVLRGGILAVDRGQTEAARSLGMTNWQTMLKVVFPQAVKNSIPAIGNEFIINIKDSSVLSVIGVMALMYATKSVSGIYFRSLEHLARAVTAIADSPFPARCPEPLLQTFEALAPQIREEPLRTLAQYERTCDTCLRCSPFMVEKSLARTGVHGTDEHIPVRSYLQGIRVLMRIMELGNVNPSD